MIPAFQFRVQPLLALSALVALVACDDDPPTAPVVPDVGTIAVDQAALAYGALDVNFGASASRTVTITNTGDGTLAVASTEVVGTSAGDFLLEGGGSFTLAPGGSRSLEVAFDPSSSGVQTAAIRVASDDPTTPSLDVALSGSGEQIQFRQVDREGIPTLNTVFNHPPAFSKKAYNLAGPDQDLATYRGQFEVVLGAVANADPAGIAALLLPDALPVSLATNSTSFATLTGRALADDAVDVALLVTVGVPELQSDNVDANDLAFLAQFPYLAEPH